MIRKASLIVIAITGVVLSAAAVALSQVQPLPKPVSPPPPNPGTPVQPPPAGNARQIPPPIGNVPLPAGAPESFIAQFVDNQTIGVVRIDLNDLDLKATRDWVVQGVTDLRKTEKEVGRAQDDVGQEFDHAAGRVEKLRNAGADRVFIVFSLDDMTADHPPFAVVPLAEGRDPQPIEALFGEMFQEQGPADGQQPNAAAPMTAVIGRAVVCGATATIQRLKAATPAARPELPRAFDAGGNAQLRVALIPQEGPRKAFEEISPDLPKELGGGPIQTVSRGLQWMSVALVFPPNPSLHVLIQSPDAGTAGKLNDVITHAIEWARDRKEGPRDELAFTQMVGQLKPKLEGDRITIDLSPEDTQKLAATMASGLLNARTQATRIQVASNLRQLDMGVMMYANDHKEQFPKDLGGDVSAYLGGADGFKRLWVDPLRPNQQKPYVYLKLADKMSDVKDPAQAVMIYENHTTWDNGINVAFADGHVEWVADEKQFKQMLDDTKKNNPQAAEMPQ